METASTVLCSSLKLLFTDNPTLYSILTENLFMVPNKSAFEQLMYPLLQIINKQKCTNMPPVNRITEAKFRSEVLRIIKEISVEYPALQIPSVTPTLFLTPGGEKFIDLMNKLSSLALEIKVKNMINCKPGMTMLSRPSSLKKDEVETCTKVLESLTLYHKQRFEDCRHQREKTVTDFKSNLLQVRDVQSKLHNKTEEIITAIKMVVDQFPCEPEKKRKLMELDGGAISEWAEELEKYETELDKKEQRLEAQNEQLRELYKAVQSLDSSCVTPVVLDAAEILPSSLDSEVDSRIQPLYEDSKLIMSKFLMLADESLKSVTTELSGAHIVDISNLILQLEEIAEIQMQTRQMAAYSKEKLLELQSQILGTEEEKVINGGNASGKTLEDFSHIADKVSLESPTMNGFQNEVVGKMGSSGLELPFKKSTPPFGLINRDATKVPYTADDLSMTPLTSQINNFDFNTRSNFERDMESATNLLAPSTIKKKPRKPFFSNISSTGCETDGVEYSIFREERPPCR
ncbi:HAUS augmin-like complex subunit 6 isoform X2 [Anabrus simplex]|uniref:HAUS augmin-like complex subunit 6 isoform X2 n=1 Tax=Anabrus simplex TaxID=316456 RepID=UPI0035A2DB7D